MTHSAADFEVEKKIEEALRLGMTELDLSLKFSAKGIQKLSELPEALGQLTHLQLLDLRGNQLTELPEAIGQLTQLRLLNLNENELTELPEAIGQLTQLQSLNLEENQLTELPEVIGQLEHLTKLKLDGNPLNPELAAAYKEGLDAVKAYLRAKASNQITLNEAKLILVGEGEVGKTCLMDALEGIPY